MNRLLVFLNLFIISSLFLYGFLTGNLFKNQDQTDEGIKLLIQLHKANLGHVISENRFKYLEIDLVLTGAFYEYQSFLESLGYKNINPSGLFCKKGNSIHLNKSGNEISLKYRYNSQECNGKFFD